MGNNCFCIKIVDNLGEKRWTGLVKKVAITNTVGKTVKEGGKQV